MGRPNRYELYQKARSLLIRARLYRFFAVAFAFTGLALFLLLYFRNIEGQFLYVLSRPSSIVTILFPFLPAFVLSLMAARAEKNFKKFMDENGQTKDNQKD